ncbi:hypothetical protein MRX96_021325 [Rhipicephalus microplus]
MMRAQIWRLWLLCPVVLAWKLEAPPCFEQIINGHGVQCFKHILEAHSMRERRGYAFHSVGIHTRQKAVQIAREYRDCLAERPSD